MAADDRTTPAEIKQAGIDWNLPEFMTEAAGQGEQPSPARFPECSLEQEARTRGLRKPLAAGDLVMDVGEAGGLRQLLNDLGRFVRRMHTGGIFHRDLTGGNLLLRRRKEPADFTVRIQPRE